MSYTGLGQQARRRRRGFGFRGQISMWVTDHRAPALCNTITAVSCKSAKGRTGTDGSSHTHLHTQQPAACWTCFSPCAVYPGHYSTYVYDRARVLPKGFMNTPSDCEIDPARDAAGAACLSRPHAKSPLTASRGEPKYGAAEQYPHSFVVEFDRSLGGFGLLPCVVVGARRRPTRQVSGPWLTLAEAEERSPSGAAPATPLSPPPPALSLIF